MFTIICFGSLFVFVITVVREVLKKPNISQPIYMALTILGVVSIYIPCGTLQYFCLPVLVWTLFSTFVLGSLALEREVTINCGGIYLRKDPKVNL